mgnify:FL=1
MTDDQIRRAVALWNGGSTLGQIAADLGVGVYDMSFLYRAATRYITRNPNHPDEEPIILDADAILASFR